MARAAHSVLLMMKARGWRAAGVAAADGGEGGAWYAVRNDATASGSGGESGARRATRDEAVADGGK